MSVNEGAVIMEAKEEKMYKTLDLNKIIEKDKQIHILFETE